MPEYDMVERHSIDIDAEPETAYSAAKTTDLGRSIPIQVLFGIRAIPAILRGQRMPILSLTIEDLTSVGFVVLEEEPGVEIVVGAVGRFWRPANNIEHINPEDFFHFDEPGFAKGVMNLRADDDGIGSILSTETRVICTDDAARRYFRRYWKLIGPFSGLIRRLMLQKMKTSAERAEGYPGFEATGSRGT